MLLKALISILCLWALLPLDASTPRAEVSNLSYSCPTEDFRFVTCLPTADEVFYDRKSDNNEDAEAFRALGGEITSSCTDVIIRVVDLRLTPVPQSCDDTLNMYRIFELYDGDPDDPFVIPEKCTITYRAIVSMNLMREGGFPDDTVISCDGDIETALQDYIENYGYQQFSSCSDVSLRSQAPNDPASTIQYECPHTGFVRVQFILIDECGYQMNTISNFRIADEEPPEFTYCPLDFEIDLLDERRDFKIDSLFKAAEAIDNCGSVSISTNLTIDDLDFDNCDPVQEYNIVYAAVDECENTRRNCSANLRLINSGEVIIDCPDTLKIDCRDPMDSLIYNTWVSSINASDYKNDIISPENISSGFNVLLLEQTFCNDGFDITFTAEGPCGNTSNCLSHINIIDQQNPIIEICPENIEVNAAYPLLMDTVFNWLATFEASDQCNPSLSLRHTFDMDQLDYQCGNQVFEVVFIADDQCNKIDSFACVSTITIIDNVVAEFTNFPLDTLLECQVPLQINDLNAWISEATASNNLEQNFDINFSLDENDSKWSECGEIFDIEITFEDQCSNIISRAVSVEIQDTTIPEINCPDPITLFGEFGDLQLDITSWLESADESDNCGIKRTQSDYSSTRFDPCLERDSQLVTFFTEDNCGNFSSTCVSKLSIVADKQPSISCPNPLILVCGDGDNENNISNWLSQAAGLDFRGDPLSAEDDFDMSTIELMTCYDSLEVLFKIIDNCGVEKNCTSYILVEDLEAPVITCPNAITINSTDDGFQEKINNWLTSAAIFDQNCLSSTLTDDFDFDNFDSCEEAIIQVTFTATDPCGLDSACESTLVVQNQMPQINCPSPLELNCSDPDLIGTTTQYLNTTTGTDNNGASLPVEFDPNLLLPDQCDQSVNITLTVTDICSNTKECSVAVTLIDNIDPRFDCPDILSLLSGDPDKSTKYLAWIEAITIEDCSATVLTSSFDTTVFVVDCEEQAYTVDLMVVDGCNNSSSCNSEIVITNNVTTQFVNCDPSNNLSLECGAIDNNERITLWLNSVTAEDNLGNTYSLLSEYNANDPAFQSCTGTVDVTFELIDFCNASSSCNLSILLSDNIEPMITCPLDTSLILEDPNYDALISSWLLNASGFDSCDMSPLMENNYERISELAPCEISETREIIFIITDHCGYENSCSTFLTVNTEKSPTISCPQDELLLECNDPNNPMIIEDWINSVVGIDTEGSQIVPDNNFDLRQLEAITCNGSLEINFEFTDGCGNFAECTSIINIEDSEAPLIDCPDNLELNSTDLNNNSLSDEWFDAFMSSDNCGTTTTEFQGINPSTLDICELAESNEILFVAMDECGLQSECSALILINQEEPSIICPDHLSLQCGQENTEDLINDWLLNFVGTDNSGASILVENNYDLQDLILSCQDTTHFNFSITDQCDLEANCIRSIIVTDTTAPNIIFCPNDLTIDVKTNNLELEIQTWLDQFETEDNCTSVFEGNDYNLDLDEITCSADTLVSFVSEDSCGNKNSCEANLSFENVLDVSIICPDPMTVECGSPGFNNQVIQFLNSYTPNSEIDFIVESSLDASQLDPICNEGFSEEVILTLIDDCNNVAECLTTLNILPTAQVYIPNIFNPNATGDNAFFSIKANEAVSTINAFRIYSRWGDLVYSKNNFDINSERGWDGRNKAGQFEQGVYTYITQFEDIYGNSYERLGTITLIF